MTETLKRRAICGLAIGNQGKIRAAMRCGGLRSIAGSGFVALFLAGCSGSSSPTAMSADPAVFNPPMQEAPVDAARVHSHLSPPDHLSFGDRLVQQARRERSQASWSHDLAVAGGPVAGVEAGKYILSTPKTGAVVATGETAAGTAETDAVADGVAERAAAGAAADGVAERAAAAAVADDVAAGEAGEGLMWLFALLAF